MMTNFYFYRCLRVRISRAPTR